MEKLGCGITDLFRSITKYEIGHKCDMSLSLYTDKDSETPECTHSISSRSRHNLLKLTALACLAAVAISTLCAICSCVCGTCKGR